MKENIETTQSAPSWEDIKELIPKKVSLHYIDYNDSLDEKTELLEECMKAGSADKLHETAWDWYIDD